MAKQWLDNAFWETEKKELLNCISVDYDDEGREVRSVHKLKKYVADGTLNPLFDECVQYLGEEAIDVSTKARRDRKKSEAEMNKQKEEEQGRARKLEMLFQYKLETFEIEEIKNSRNRTLRSRLRRAKSIPEVNLYAMMIMKEVIDAEE